jgi:hypothetical protein
MTISIIIDFLFVLDIFFLNREPMRNVKNAEELIPVFAVPPAGKEEEECFVSFE